MGDAAGADHIRSADPDRDWPAFGTGVQVWIGQTFCRLRDRGRPVTLASTPPAAGTAVVHKDDLAALVDRHPDRSALRIIAVRADRRGRIAADLEIVQNAAAARGNRTFVPHWPQPGLIPRDPGRGTAVRTAAFKGAHQQLVAAMRAAGWADALAALGVAWRSDAARWRGPHARYEVGWNDYADVDLVVALRQPAEDLHPRKPATKLINAWLAGVPAILGPEVAYRELRRGRLDYVEAADPPAVLAAIRRLREEPGLYRAMVANGHERARDFSVDRIAARWEEVLWG